MKQSKLAIISLALVAATLLAYTLFTLPFLVSVQDSIRKERIEQVNQELNLVVLSLRNELLLGNTRLARTRLSGLASLHVYESFDIRQNGSQAASLFNPVRHIPIEVPVFYSENEGRWGSVVFHVNKERIDSETRNTFAVAAAGLLITTGLGLILLFSLIKAFTVIVRHLFEQLETVALSEQVGKVPAPIAWLFSPFIESLQQIASTLKTRRQELDEIRVQAAIARTTQMLAHDVRRPFSMLKMTLDLLGKAESHDDVRKIIRTASVDVQRAMASVNGLIQDVMEIDTKGELAREVVRLDTLVHASLTETFRLFPKADVTIRYELDPSAELYVDIHRVMRVFLNILGNAVQAMNQKGELWVRATERPAENGSAPLLEVVLGNSGSYIPPDDLPRLFDAFFTKGKKGGTGLGLAIAKKVITAHGGAIWCESSETLGVEFHFTLPIKTAGDTPPQATSDGASKTLRTTNTISTVDKAPEALVLPSHARDFAKVAASASDSSALAGNETNLESAAVAAIKELGRSVRVLIVDDEALYRNAISQHLTSSPELAEHAQTHLARNSSEALAKALGEHQPDLVVLDVDLGAASQNGFEILAELRRQNSNAFVCVHTNRTLASDNQEAIAAGADAFLPKPMARSHLLRLVLQATEKQLQLRPQSPTSAAARPTQPKPLLVALVDDDALVQMSWNMNLGSTVRCFDSPEAFFNAAQSEASLIASLTGVVTDLNFGNESCYNGISFADELRKTTNCPILLSTNATMTAAEHGPSINKVIPKAAPASAEELVALLKGLKSGDP